MASLPRPRKPLQPVSVQGRFLQRPVAPCEILPQGAPGVLLIDGSPYLVSIIGELPPEGEPLVFGWRVVKHDGTHYDIDTRTAWGQWQCDCPDATYRGERPGGCRHAAALRQALKDKETRGHGDKETRTAVLLPVSPCLPVSLSASEGGAA
jgi:hypothetical protein